jgi:hypothetical protein
MALSMMEQIDLEDKADSQWLDEFVAEMKKQLRVRAHRRVSRRVRRKLASPRPLRPEENQ